MGKKEGAFCYRTDHFSFRCTACGYSPAEYNDIDIIAAGTELNRSYSYNMEVGLLYIQIQCWW